MPVVFKSVINESGTNLEDALNKTHWAHWVFKTNAAVKVKMVRQSKVDSSSSDSDEEALRQVVTAEDHCPSKDYTFPEYNTFVAFHAAHPLLSRQRGETMITQDQESARKARDKRQSWSKERSKVGRINNMSRRMSRKRNPKSTCYRRPKRPLQPPPESRSVTKGAKRGNHDNTPHPSH
eukprot:scaffold158022_cov69-Attheya_sp.AAC.1